MTSLTFSGNQSMAFSGVNTALIICDFVYTRMRNKELEERIEALEEYCRKLKEQGEDTNQKLKSAFSAATRRAESQTQKTKTLESRMKHDARSIKELRKMLRTLEPAMRQQVGSLVQGQGDLVSFEDSDDDDDFESHQPADDINDAVEQLMS